MAIESEKGGSYEKGNGWKGCGLKEESAPKDEATTSEETVETGAEEETVQEDTEEENDLTPEQKELLKYNYYVELNNQIITVLDNIHLKNIRKVEKTDKSANNWC